MMFRLFDRQLDPHVRKSLELLKEANLAHVEHRAAAEHHTALAEMYAARIARIEVDMGNGVLPRSLLTPQRQEQSADEGECVKGEAVGAYPPRAIRS